MALRSDNGDVPENVAEQLTSHHYKIFRDFPTSPCSLTEARFGWSSRKRPRPSSNRDGIIYRLAVPVLKKLKIWSFHVVVVQKQ